MNMKTRFNDYMSFFHEQASSDEADSVVVSVVCVFPFIMLMLGWSVDFSKNVVIRSDLEEIALESVQAAIRAQDGIGNVECTNTDWLNYNEAVNAVKAGRSSYGSATKLALKTYLIKTGRATDADFSGAVESDLKGGIYNGGGSRANVNKVAADNDSKEVATYRFAGDDTDYGPRAFRIKITCSNAADRANLRHDAASEELANQIGTRKDRVDTVSISVKDWTSNVFLSMPLFNDSRYMDSDGINMDDVIHSDNDNTQVQRFNIEQSAISTWSSTSLNAGGTKIN